jgi:hypothetical protein
MQIPETSIGQVMALLAAGYGLAVLAGLVILGGKIWRHALGWIDDSEAGRNPVLDFFARLRGWKPSESLYGQRWVDRKGSDQHDAAFLPIFGVIWAPISIYLTVRFYPVLLTALTLFAVAHVARFARRHKKLFDKHLKDPSAHTADNSDADQR